MGLIPEARVVVLDLLEALARDAPAARDVLEERHHLVHALRSPERDDEHGIEVRLRNAGAEPSRSRRRGRVWHRRRAYPRQRRAVDS